jgi:hypothetical protein
MLQISISSELAVEHSGFVAGCAERGHAVEVFAGTDRDENASEGTYRERERFAEDRSGRVRAMEGR